MPLLILVAEDDRSIRTLVRDYLESSGYSVILAKDGNEALIKLQTYHPHLLISDIKMPYINGYELVKKIRQLPQFRLLPVIFLTEYRDMEERILGYQAGCDIYLPKPFEVAELGAIIRNLLERAQTVHSALMFPQEQNLSEKQKTDSEKLFSSIDLDTLSEFELTARETEVLGLLIDGCSNVEIGNHLHLSPRTIEKYVSSLLRKTKKSNRFELIRFALEHHLI